MFAVFKRAISCRSSCTLWRNCSIVVATVRLYKRGVRSVHKTEHLSAAFGSVAPKTPRYRENQGQPLVGAWLIGTTKSVPVTRPAKMTMLCPVLRRADRYTIPEKSPYPFEIQYPIDCRRAGTALGMERVIVPLVANLLKCESYLLARLCATKVQHLASFTRAANEYRSDNTGSRPPSVW